MVLFSFVESWRWIWTR